MPKSAGVKERVAHVGHRAHVLDRLLRIERPDHAHGGRHQRARSERRAEHEREAHPPPLPCVVVHRGRRLFREAVLLDVGHEADHLPRLRPRHERQRHALAERIRLAPQQLRGVAAHQQHLDVAVRDVAPAQDGDAHRPQVAGRQRPHPDRRLVARQELGASHDDDRLHRSADERQVVDRARRCDSGQRAQARQRRVEEGRALRVGLVARLRQRDVHRQDALGIEAGVDAP